MNLENLINEDWFKKLQKKQDWTSQQTFDIIQTFVELISERLIAGDRIILDEFAVFSVVKRPEYIEIYKEKNERYLMPPSLELLFEPLVSPDSPKDEPRLSFEPDESFAAKINAPFVDFMPTVMNDGVFFPDIETVVVDEYANELNSEITLDEDATESKTESEVADDKVMEQTETEISDIETKPKSESVVQIEKDLGKLKVEPGEPTRPRGLEDMRELESEPGVQVEGSEDQPKVMNKKRNKACAVLSIVLGGALIAIGGYIISRK